MKKTVLILIILIALSAFALTACGGEPTEAPPSPPQQEEAAASPPETANSGEENDPGLPEEDDEPQAIPDFAFKMGDVLIEMDKDIEDVLEKLGEPQGIFEQESCAFDGIDRIFGYPGVQIHTYPKGDRDFIHTVSLRDDSHKTTEGGIRNGDDIQKALDAYGDDYTYNTGVYKYTRGLTTLEFFTEDDTIIRGITYGFIIEM